MRRYLIVDDNVAFAENLAEIITDAGAGEAVVIESGSRALELAGRERFDALLSDMRMPVMSGAELVHRIRRVDPELPAIVITAYTADTDLQAARQEGLLGVLPKPVPVPRLLELLSVARRNGIVALVEDEVELADNLSEALRLRGFASVTAHSVVETERLGVTPFAAVVDLRLPGGADGEAMKRLATKFPGLPMIVITAHGGTTPPAPSVAYFEKPFDTAALLAVVERLHG